MSGQRKFSVTAQWDDEAEVWYVSDTDVPGLATEAATIDELVRKLKVMVPEMLELNGLIDASNPCVPFSFMAEVVGADHRC